MSADVVANVLDAAARAGIVTERPGRPGTMRFTHALVANAAEADLPAPRRRRLRLAGMRAITVGRHVVDASTADVDIAEVISLSDTGP